MNISPLTGTIITPDHPDYEKLRRSKNLYFSFYPALIVYPSNVEDVINAVNYAKENNLNIRCRCGGHHYEGFCVGDDGLVIDLTNLVSFNFDKKTGIAKIGAGFLQADLYQKLNQEGFGFMGGSCGGVGIGGIFLGAGVGLTQRQYGLGSDNLIEIELIDYCGHKLVANDEQNRDLFFALRGAGSNNFGVVTSYTLKAYPVDEVTLIDMTWPESEAAKVIEAFQSFAPYIDKRITAKLNMAPGEIKFGSVTTFADIDFTLAQIAPLLEIKNRLTYEAKTLLYMDYILAYGGSNTPPEYYKRVGNFAYCPMTSTDVKLIYSALNAFPQGEGTPAVGYLAMGGQIAENTHINSCFAHREALFLLQIESNWTERDNVKSDEYIAWAEKLKNTLYPNVYPAYLNYPDIFTQDYRTAYFGSNVATLQSIKQKYNPSNLFDYPQSL